MKQCITDEQFLSLTFEQSLKLMELMGYPQEDASEEFYYNNKHIIARRFAHVIEKINIGKMIELLRKSGYDFNGDWGNLLRYQVVCDCLWECIKVYL